VHQNLALCDPHSLQVREGSSVACGTALAVATVVIDASGVKAVLDATWRGDHGFGELLCRLDALGVERYCSDLVRFEATFYVRNGSILVPAPLVRTPPAPTLSIVGVEVASRALHGGRIGYDEFRERLATAGCVSYMVSLLGRRCAYFDRLGESYNEALPRSVWPERMGWPRAATIRPMQRTA